MEASLSSLGGRIQLPCGYSPHFSPTFKQQTAELIAGKLTKGLGTNLGTEAEKTNDQPEDWSNVLLLPPETGGADGIRTRDLRRDRPAF